MKKLILIEILRKLRAKPNLMRKVKIFAAVGVVGFLVTSGLVIWAGISAFSYVAGKANEVIQSPEISAQVASLKTEAKGLSRLQPLSCWGKAQSLVAVEPWIARPAWDNLKNLKVACLEPKPAVCEGHECSQMKQLINTAKGTAI